MNLTPIKNYRHILPITLLVLSLFGSGTIKGSFVHYSLFGNFVQPQDTTRLPLPLPKVSPFSEKAYVSPLFLNAPGNLREEVEYDPIKRQYIIYRRIGRYNVEPPRVMTAGEYRDYLVESAMRSYWKQKQSGETAGKGNGILPRIQVGGETFDRIFGSNTIEIIPQGNAELVFGISSSKTENPALPVDQRRNITFDFQSKIQMNISGKIGEKLNMEVNYNTEATFDFENNVKVEYNGFEDEIIQRIEAGNVSLPLPGTLITGSQSLFGFKTQLKFGRLNVTSVVSKQNGQTQVVEIKGGAQVRDFEIRADDYDANRHFFLSHFFRENYNRALRNLPVINSGVKITKLEVWITNKQANFENSRNIIAFADLGEDNAHIFAKSVVTQTGTGPTDNSLNNLYELMTTTYSGIRDIAQINTVLAPLEAQGFSGGRDYEKIENARKLSPNEFSFNADLGFISLSSALNTDEVLAVAYEYTKDGKTYKVGELSTDGVSAPQTLILKLLKGTNLSPKLPTWRLMMKNIYSMNAYQVSKDNFRLDVLYQDDETGTPLNYIKEGNIANKPLISVLNLDNLNSQLDANPDGVFDFIPGVTINPAGGKIIFPVLEPFGRDLAAKISDPIIASRYTFQELYDSTLTKARQVADKNKFLISGSYQSAAGSEIYLNAPNIPKGSVVVTAGGSKLQEDVHYIVDYNLGSVRIIDQGLLESGTPIRVSVESNALFSLQTKTLIGSHFDYRFSDNFNVGATIMNLTERPLTQKVNFGNEAISNTIWGFNTSYQTESKFLTRMIDFLPFIQTKEKSTISFDAEFAYLIPGHSRAIGKSGTVYLDDFEGSNTSLEIRSWVDWKLASTPQGQPQLFPEGGLTNDLRYGMNRARLAWYYIDPLFLRNTALTPSYLRNNKQLQGSHFVREIFERELFPNRNTPQGQPTNIPVLNLAFYPDERGPYNYDNTNITPDGKLMNPTLRWGGIMRNLGTTDFEASNIEYIEFWLMDPFVYDTLMRGGDFYINLGNISEDILKDGRKVFENGLPTSARMSKIDTTVWGRIPTKQYLPVGFDNDAGKRKYQDIGLDGLADEDLDGDGIPDEQSFFSDYLNGIRSRISNQEVIARFDADPSADNFRHYLNSYYDKQQASILDRYKYFNNTEGNSPVATGTTSEQSYSTPDVEELGIDNTMNENEAYYQYRISLRPADMVVGKNFITNIITGEKDKIKNKPVKWYQFKIPISEYESKFGPIEDFKSIRFMRMILRGFDDTLILRFATLNLVRGEWRKYNFSLIQGQEGIPSADLPTSSFAISSVNIEENDKRTPVNYVLPPGVNRVIDPSQPQITELNEQAMEYRIIDLADGDAKAAFKNVNIDIRQYKRLKMDVHAEMVEGHPLRDNELTAFVRLGSDYTNNYYEYEIPLKLTPWGFYYNGRKTDREIVWPRENLIDINLEQLVDVKLARNRAMQQPGSTVTYNTLFTVQHDGRYFRVTGNPNLSNVKVIMIGVRNPASAGSAYDDGLPKSAVIWFNEFRLTNFNNQGGWAANARLSAKLADLGMVTVAGTTITPGFGSIEKKVNERSKENLYQYDVSSTLELGKLFPKKLYLRIPMFFGYSESISNPQYNPLDPDVTLRRALKNATASERDSIKRIVQDYSRRKSINFTNVKIDNPKAKPGLFSISNFALSYSFSEFYSRNIRVDHNIQRSIRGALTYNYNKRPKFIKPFGKIKWLRSKYLRLIRDFNFNLVPSQLSFRTDLNRNYYEQQFRNVNNPNVVLLPTYSKDFLWNRNYALNWDITRSIKFDFTASNTARIDEPDGMVDRRRDPRGYEHWRDSVWANIKRFGRNTMYNHQFNLTYSLPLSKIPFLDWTNATGRYTGIYRWQAGPVMADTSSFDPGNIAQNSNTIQLNGQVNLKSLFNKVGFLKRINQEFDRRARGAARRKMKTVTQEFKGINLRANANKTINHKLKTEKVTVKVFDAGGRPVKVKLTVRSDKRIAIRADKAYKNCRVVVQGRVPDRMNPFVFALKSATRLMMSVRSISLSYSETNGTLLPGYKPGPRYLGVNPVNGVIAPGWEFVSGWQDPNIAWKAANNGWLTRDTSFNSPVVLTHNENLNFRTSVEPVPGFRIEISANRTYSRNHNETFRANLQGQYQSFSPITTGNFSISVISLKTAFEGKNRAERSDAFETFKRNRLIIARRLSAQRVPNPAEGYDPNELDPVTGFPIGYGPLSQDVLRPSFLAAYTDISPNSVTLADFPKIPMPNWQITYDGLAKLKPFKKLFRSFTLTHGYRSNYSIGSFTTNLDYLLQDDGFSYVRNINGDFIPQREITNVALNEQFSPLIGLDIGWQNNLTTRLEYKKSRSLAMSFANNQLTEIYATEYIIGAGYRFENVPLIFKSASGGKRAIKSNLRLTFDLSVRDNTTILRKLVEDSNEIIAGQLISSIKTSADYRINEQVTIRLFFDRTLNAPKVSRTFRTTNTNFGFSVRFELVK